LGFSAVHDNCKRTLCERRCRLHFAAQEMRHFVCGHLDGRQLLATGSAAKEGDQR
jgi:monoamine oxidase